MMEIDSINDVNLSGNIENVKFRNEGNGWTVLELESENSLHIVVGTFPEIGVGEHLEMVGEWAEHPRFGAQFKMSKFKKELPATGEAIHRYLSSGVIKGIGPATATRIVEMFGKESLDIIENHPEKLSKIKGITLSRAQNISEEYQRQAGLREVMIAFADYGITPAEAMRCYKRWGDDTVEKIKGNPYLLCSSGLYIGFERADFICAQMGRSQEDIYRVKAGIVHILRHNIGNGHTCLPRQKLIGVAAGLLGVESYLVEAAMEELVIDFSIVEEAFNNSSDGKSELTMVFLNSYYRCEKFISDRISMINLEPLDGINKIEHRIKVVEKKREIEYAPKQKQAISMAVTEGSLILTGGPGTGKTTTLCGIIELLEDFGLDVALAAPTGKAAQRMSELTSTQENEREAKTIHRLLEVQWDDDDSPYFARNEQNPLDCNAVVVDELSMVDAKLFESLLRALKPDCRLILVGDYDQLPAVGAGSVLLDLMESKAMPMVELNEVFRQAMESTIVMSAHKIVDGEMPALNHKSGDLFFMKRDVPSDALSTLISLCESRIPKAYNISVFDGLQVLCPGKNGELGTRNLNKVLQHHLNPPSDTDKDDSLSQKREIHLDGIAIREGDKVMHIRNNYNIAWERDGGTSGEGIFNGDIGIVMQINPYGMEVAVRYDDRVAIYNGEDINDLELAYAITIHKSQGSEFEGVIIPTLGIPRPLCYRNLLYTGVTRAKNILILVGNENNIRNMVNNDRQTKRYSGLKYFLLQEKPSEDELDLIFS